MKKLSLRATAVAVAALATTSAFATDGYFPHGYGMKALGMGGASVAMTDNAFAGANNPATAAYAGNRYELGVNLFSPKRSAVTMGQSGPMETQSDSNYFLVPEFGYNRDIDAKTSFGVTVYGNGGMNTDYPAPIMGGNASTAGVDLMQLIVAPTVAYKLNDFQSIGVSPLLVYQKFKAAGLSAFNAMSVPSGNTGTDSGSDSSTGIGVRLGYFAKANEQVSFGASYSPKINMGKLSGYAGLFANGGDFDIPANATVGLAIQATPQIKIAADYQKIKYGSVPAIANSSLNIFGCMQQVASQCLGGSDGPGFGWTDVNVIKLGVEWAYSSSVTLRAGFNKSTNPVKSAEVSFNILAPAVITKHYTFGGTYKLAKDSELTWAYMYAPKNSVTGNSLFGQMSVMNPQSPNYQGSSWNDTVRMSQQSIGVQYGWKF
jgi:long-chain fatty acid transport protein